jgi:hypothetical protein
MPDLEKFWASESEKPGVLYIIDEAHLLFDARHYKDTAEALTVYNSQHAKLLDDCIFVTQFLGLIEKRVKGFAEYFHVFRNFAGVKTMQFLAMPGRIRESIYSVEPGGAAKADEEHWHKMDFKRAACYSTMTGVGLAGGTRVDQRKVKGFRLPWWAVFVGIITLGLGLWYGTQAISKKVVLGLGKVDPGVSRASAVPVRGAGGSNAVETAERVEMTGFSQFGSRVEVFLTDGRVLTENELKAVSKDRAIGRDGRVYAKQRKRAQVAEPPGASETAQPVAAPGGRH